MGGAGAREFAHPEGRPLWREHLLGMLNSRIDLNFWRLAGDCVAY